MVEIELPRRRTTRLDLTLYESASQAYFLTTCTQNSAALFCDVALAREVLSCLLTQRGASRILVFAYCLMPDHLHVLCSPSEDGHSVIRFMDSFKGKSTRVCWSRGVKGKVWQRGFYDHILRSEENLTEIAEYIVANPLRAGLVERQGRYEFCGTPDLVPKWW